MGTRPKNIRGTDPVCQFDNLFSWLTETLHIGKTLVFG